MIDVQFFLQHPLGLGSPDWECPDQGIPRPGWLGLQTGGPQIEDPMIGSQD